MSLVCTDTLQRTSGIMFSGLYAMHIHFLFYVKIFYSHQLLFSGSVLLGRMTTICQLIAGLQKPISDCLVTKNVLHVGEELDRFREKRKQLKDWAITLSHTLFSLEVNKMKRKKVLTSRGKIALEPKRARGVQLLGNEKLKLPSWCQRGHFLSQL